MGTKSLEVTKHEAELIMDSFKVSTPLTRNLALKAMGLVLEFDAEQTVLEASLLVQTKEGPPNDPEPC